MRGKDKCLLIAGIIVILLCVSLFVIAQAEREGIETLHLKAEVRLLQVEAFVYDEAGNFVPGLSKEDFELHEDGKQQLIRYVDEIKSNVEVKESEVVEYILKDGLAVANINSVILIFDGCNSSHTSIGKIKTYIKEFIEKNAAGRNYFSIFSIDNLGNFKLEQNFTNSSEKIIHAIDEVSAGVGGVDPMNSRIRLLDSIVESVQRCVAIRTLLARQICAEEVVKMAFNQAKNFSKDEQRRSTRTIESLKNIFQFLRHIPGNKLVIFFSDGFDPSGNIYLTYLHEIVEQWKASYNITINVDQIMHEARQLTFQEMSNISLVQRLINKGNEARIKFYWLNPQNPDELFGADSSLKGVVGTSRVASVMMDNLVSVSEDTGGFAFRNGAYLNDFFNKIASNMQNYYLISYIPDRVQFDGKSHKIKINVKKPGYNVRARKTLVDYTFNDQISIMIASALDFADVYKQIPILIEYSYLLDENNKINAITSIAIAFESLTPQYEGNKVIDQIHFAYIIKDNKDEIVIKEHKVLNIDVSKEEYEELSRKGSHFQNIYSFNLSPGEYKLSAAVLELGGMKLTGWNTPLSIKLKNEQCFTLNPLIVASETQEILNNGENKRDTNSINLLPDGSIIYKNNKIIISPAKFLPRSSKLLGLYQIYNAAVGKNGKPKLQISFNLYDDNSKLISSPPVTMIDNFTDEPKRLITNFFILPYKNLNNKSYKLVLNVKDLTNNCEDSSEATFQIR